ncbi:hypothetical protein LH128_02049 [Sphingomonas sp. LH128]|uniref:Uncharacterized protein n=1 Tax=Novosphingobium resinovorum TaxID=158500 RepID=A0A031J8N7_9SPHN|nr:MULTISPECIES: hypothetical protein [Sphingomonadaceae]EJU14755.1 hypothetical protein LH128_02049 [Sphingomonas sp. LH128]EZP69588.1 hypothetical protein BV97_05565 [Novosphingobium resinovorum]
MKCTSPRLAAMAIAILGGTVSMAALAAPQHLATPAHAPKATALVAHTMTRNPGLLDILLHVTPPGSNTNSVVAAHLPDDLGEISGDDDVGVARTGKPLVEVQKDGVRIGVLLQLRDARRRPIGAVGIMAPWHEGDSQKAALERAVRIRDEMARQIPSRAALFR